MALADPRTPVIIGVGQVTEREQVPRISPLGLMLDAARSALADTGAGEDDLAARIQSVAVVDCFTWAVPDPARALAEALGAGPRETVRTLAGGTSPLDLLRDACTRIASGELDMALLAGGEAARSLHKGWYRGGPDQLDGTVPTRTIGTRREPGHPAEQAAGLFMPIGYYPLFENAVRAAAGRSVEEHSAWLAWLWSRFAEVAGDNPYAWRRDAPGPQAIATPGRGNRPVAFPYTTLMNANIHVDQAAALVVCSAQAAEAAGVPRDRWVFVHATAAAHDHWFVAERVALHRSPAIAAVGQAVLGHAGVGIDEVAHLDLYSCFPCVVQIAAAELGLGLEADSRTPTVTGGLTFAGGPASNYVMHALAALVPRLREDPAGFGLSTGLGWYVTKHAAAVLSARPPRHPFSDVDVQAGIDALPRRGVAEDARARAPVETYTVMYDYTASPVLGIVSCLLPDGSRALARSEDPATVAALLDGDALGHPVRLDGARFEFAG